MKQNKSLEYLSIIHFYHPQQYTIPASYNKKENADDVSKKIPNTKSLQCLNRTLMLKDKLRKKKRLREK